jgi:hypothetical protein
MFKICACIPDLCVLNQSGSWHIGPERELGGQAPAGTPYPARATPAREGSAAACYALYALAPPATYAAAGSPPGFPPTLPKEGQFLISKLSSRMVTFKWDGLQENRRLFPASNPSAEHIEMTEWIVWKLFLGLSFMLWGLLLCSSAYCGWHSYQARRKTAKRNGQARSTVFSTQNRPDSVCWKAQRWLCWCVQGGGKSRGQVEFKVLLCLSIESIFYMAWLVDPKSYNG